MDGQQEPQPVPMPPVPEQQLRSVEPLDLEDGNFVVHTKDGGVEEGGWGVLSYYEAADDNGDLVKRARLMKMEPTADKRYATRDVTMDELQSWQAPPEQTDDGQPELLLTAVSEVVEDVGETAVEATNVEVEPTPVLEEQVEDLTPTEVEETDNEILPEVKALDEPIAEDAPTETKPETEVEPVAEAMAALNRMSLQDALTSPASFERVLADPNTDPQLKTELVRLKNTWQEMQLAGTTNEVWQQEVAPRLQQLQAIAPGVQQSTQQALHAVTEMREGLTMVMRAVHEGQLEYIADAMQRSGIKNWQETFEAPMNQLLHSEGLKQAGLLLNAQALEADDRVRRVTAGVGGPLNDVDAEAFFDTVQPMAQQGLQAEQIQAQLQNQAPQDDGRWRQRKQAIEELLNFSRLTQPNPDIAKAFMGLRNEIEGFLQMARQGRYDGAQLQYMAHGASMNHLMQELEMASRMTRWTAQLAEEIR